MKTGNKTLTPKMLMKKMSRSMAYLDKLSFLENYAMFMGKAQLIEFKLKKILSVKRRYSESKLDRMPLGVVISELERLGIRKDFISLLRDLKKFRNDMAHEFLVSHLSRIRLDHRFGRLSWKPLRNAIFRLGTVHVFDFLNQNRYLYRGQRKVY
jgi:hypothetical protein